MVSVLGEMVSVLKEMVSVLSKMVSVLVSSVVNSGIYCLSGLIKIIYKFFICCFSDKIDFI